MLHTPPHKCTSSSCASKPGAWINSEWLPEPARDNDWHFPKPERHTDTASVVAGNLARKVRDGAVRAMLLVSFVGLVIIVETFVSGWLP